MKCKDTIMGKRFILMTAMLMGIGVSIHAQKVEEKDSVALQEVVVKAARVVNKVDGKLIYPSDVQKQNSHSGFSLLSKLALPNIRVDEVARSISAVDHKGEVQVRINGIVANMHDVQTLDVASITHIDYINSPGVRYGKDIVYVIDIRTRRATTGGSLGFDLSNALTTKYGKNDVYGSVNRGKSQLYLFYEQAYANNKGSEYHEDAQYLLNDGSEYDISRRIQHGATRYYDNTLQLKYNLADSASYVFQASLSADFSNQPRRADELLFSESIKNVNGQSVVNGSSFSPSETIVHRRNKSRDFTPTLDLYFFHQLGKHQSLTADVLGTYIRTKSDHYEDEGEPYQYQVDGKTYSMIGEAIYENRLKPFTFSAGLHMNWKYMDNHYLGDAVSENGIHSSGAYGFAQIKGSLFHREGETAKLKYVAGFGLSNQTYRQGEEHYSFWLTRPKVSLAYQINAAFQLRYDFELSQHISQVAMLAGTRIRKNSMEWTVGYPSLKPNGRYEHVLTLSFSKPRISSDLSVDYRINRHCNLAKYTRTEDNQFLYMQKNQPHCNLLYVTDYTRFDIIPDHLVLTASASINRFFNKGDEYSHVYTGYNYGGTLQGYWGRWAVTLYGDSGWNFMEGENIGHNAPAFQTSVSYHLGNFDFTLTTQNLFMAHPKEYSAEIVNALVKKQACGRNSSNGNFVMLGVAWNINRGKEYRKIEKSISNRERDTGILK